MCTTDGETESDALRRLVMKRFLLSTRGCLAALVVILGLAATASSAAASPVLQVLQGTTSIARGSTFPFPSTPTGTPVSVLFTIKNNGNANLVINNPTTLVSGSGFYEIFNATTPVAPGGTTVFRVRLQSGAAGTYNGTVTIDSDDPVTPVFTFYLVGTVTAAPVVSAPTPASQSVLVGTSVSISVTASGQAPFTYAWTYSTDNVNFGPPLNNGDRGGRISGALSATLQIATTTTSDTGYYRDAVSNSYGTTTSGSSSLT